MDKYALTNCILLDGTEAMQPRKDLAILVDQGKIQAIVPAAAVPKDYPKRDLDGQYVLPGLINLHVHLPASGRPTVKQKDTKRIVRLMTSNALLRAITFRVCAGYAKTELRSGVPYPCAVTLDVERNETLAACIAADRGIGKEAQVWQAAGER